MNILDEHAPLVIRALEHYDAYLKATQRDDGRYLQIADMLKRKPATSEPGERSTKRKKA